MNKALMEQITKHIMMGFGVIPSLDEQHFRSIIDKEFLLPHKLIFKSEEGLVVNNKVYGAQLNIGEKEFKIMLGDCSQDKNIPEYCLVIKLTGNPAYGAYMVCAPDLESESLLAVTINDKDWLPCDTFLQATFLAAMEQLKDIGFSWSKCTNAQKHYELMVSMIQFHANYEDVNER